MEKKIIELPKGGDLEVEYTPEFYQKVKDHFNLSENEAIDDEHIRLFIYGACKKAIDKAEQELLSNKTS